MSGWRMLRRISSSQRVSSVQLGELPGLSTLTLFLTVLRHLLAAHDGRATQKQ